MANVMIAPATNRMIPSAANMTVLLLGTRAIAARRRAVPERPDTRNRDDANQSNPGAGPSPRNGVGTTLVGHMKAPRFCPEPCAHRAKGAQALTMCGQDARTNRHC